MSQEKAGISLPHYCDHVCMHAVAACTDVDDHEAVNECALHTVFIGLSHHHKSSEGLVR